jgi:hypothetical protein
MIATMQGRSLPTTFRAEYHVMYSTYILGRDQSKLEALSDHLTLTPWV